MITESKDLVNKYIISENAILKGTHTKRILTGKIL